MITLTCQYCGKKTEKVLGLVIYPHRKDLFDKTFYLCKPCKAWVGCHPKSEIPLGEVANAKTRRFRGLAHLSFDEVWISGKLKRQEAYRWLQEKMGLDQDSCHIGKFNTSQCEKVIELCASL